MTIIQIVRMHGRPDRQRENRVIFSVNGKADAKSWKFMKYLQEDHSLSPYL